MVGNDNSKIISVKIHMEVESKTQADKLFADSETEIANENINIKLISKNDTLAFDGNLVFEYLISFGVGVASGVVGNCIYNAIHNAAKKLEINGRRTRLTEESISQTIETIKLMLAETENRKNTDMDKKEEGICNI